MQDLSAVRLNVLRAFYLLILVGLAIEIWPLMINPPLEVELMKTVVRSVLTAVSLLALLGLRHPLEMLPLLLFELVWKTLWVLVFGIPLWKAGRLDPESAETMKATLMGVVLTPLVIPWRYLFDRYVRTNSVQWQAAQ